MRISVQEAKIDVASVELTTIKIAGKQMTLAVFRQLDSVEPKPEHNPILWGRVNYCSKDCTLTPHHHYIWQRCDSILKDVIYKPNQRTQLGSKFARNGEFYIVLARWYLEHWIDIPADPLEFGTTLVKDGYTVSVRGQPWHAFDKFSRPFKDWESGNEILGQLERIMRCQFQAEKQPGIEKLRTLLGKPTEREQEMSYLISKEVEDRLADILWGAQLYEAVDGSRHIFIAV